MISFCSFLWIIYSLILLTVASPEDFTKDTIIALQKTVDYYRSNYRNMDLDGLFGLRIIEGQLLDITESNHIIDSSERNFKKAIQSLLSDVRDTTEDIFAEESMSDRTKGVTTPNLVYFLEQPWRTQHLTIRSVDYNRLWHVQIDKASDVMSESESDGCLSQLIGTPGVHCHVGDPCIRLMMKKETIGYALQHQILFFILTGKLNCSLADSWLRLQPETSNSVTVNDFLVELCSNSLDFVHKFYDWSDFEKESDRDLLMECIFMCGHLGYYEFVSSEMLEDILSWQRESGCFGMLEEDSESKKKGKRLMAAKDLADGCSTHMTAVASGALAASLRLLVHPSSELELWRNTAFEPKEEQPDADGAYDPKNKKHMHALNEKRLNPDVMVVSSGERAPFGGDPRATFVFVTVVLLCLCLVYKFVRNRRIQIKYAYY